MRPSRWRTFAAAGLLVAATGPAFPKEGDFIASIPFPVPSPQDIARDPEDGTFWVTTFLDGSVYHLASDLSTAIETFAAPFGGGHFLTGVAYNSRDGTLFVADLLSGKILELAVRGPDRGRPTGREILPDWSLPPETAAGTFPLGLAYDPNGDSGFGSVYLVESTTSLIYEIDLVGTVIRRFSHPDDPDGFPGQGARAPACYDVEPIFGDGGELAGFYLTGGPSEGGRIRRAAADGRDTGISIPLDESGGSVSGILRLPFRPPGGASEMDAFLCVVQSSARIAVLEGGEPGFRDIVGFACAVEGNQVALSWSNPQVYDGIEILEGCTVLAHLPGTATSWRHAFEQEGVHEIRLRAYAGDRSSEPPPCTAVAGGGEVLSAGEVPLAADEGALVPIDLATDGSGRILVSATVVAGGGNLGRILVYDEGLAPLGAIDVPAAFAGPADYVTGIACDRRAGEERIYLYNAWTAELGVLDAVGALIAKFPADLPNLEEDPEEDPDLGLVLSMAYDGSGDAGRGSLWLVETVRDWIYELDLEGRRLRGFPHPYLAVEPPPEGSPYGIPSSGVSVPPWAEPGRLYLGGGALRDSGQVHILAADKLGGRASLGSAIPTDAIRAFGSVWSFAFEGASDPVEPRWFVLARARRKAWLLEVRAGPLDVPPPAFFSARERGRRNDVELAFQEAAAYDRIDVVRDCEPAGTIPSRASSWLDRDVPSGPHEYRVRGVLSRAGGEAASPWVAARVWVGRGAVLRQDFLWPADSPVQVSRDPVDGTYVVVTNAPGQERVLHLFDRGFRHLESREILEGPPWQVATAAFRHASEAEVWYIVWQQPVPLGQVEAQRFFLVAETIPGSVVARAEIRPPRPRAGFITYPTGLVWNPRTDTFLYLERNSATFVEANVAGETVREFPHPDPPYQNFVFGLGVAAAPHRTARDPSGAVLFTTAGRHDHRITVAKEMTFGGELTGFEVPLGHIPHGVTGIALDGADLIAVGTDRFAEALRIRAYDAPDGAFVRGDSNADGSVNLTDAVVTLQHLFLGGAEPACLDGADADDSGRVNLTDPVATLLALFRGAGPLPPPYPDPGFDPTDDDLSCH